MTIVQAWWIYVKKRKEKKKTTTNRKAVVIQRVATESTIQKKKERKKKIQRGVSQQVHLFIDIGLSTMHVEHTQTSFFDGGFIPAAAQSNAGASFSTARGRGVSQCSHLSTAEFRFFNIHSEQVHFPSSTAGFIPAAAQSKTPVGADTAFPWLVSPMGFKGVEKPKVGSDEAGTDLAAFRAAACREKSMVEALAMSNENTGRTATFIFSAASFGSTSIFSAGVGSCGGVGVDLGAGVGADAGANVGANVGVDVDGALPDAANSG